MKHPTSSLCLVLDSTGVSRWDVSRLTLGNSLTESLRAAINECDICIFLATKRSIISGWCLAELGAFWGAGKKVIIYQVDPEIEKSDIPPQFQGDLWTSDANKLVESLNITDNYSVRRTSLGFSSALGTMTLNVNLGRIEEFDCSDEDCLVALPANEFFDDECIHDKHSSLGAFMQHHFEDKIKDIQELVKEALKSESYEIVNKKPTETGASYGVGKCVFLKNPLSSKLRLAMVSVTTQRTNEGLRSDASYIFKAAKSLQQIMANNRLSCLYIPILGSGHGGLKQEVSLICMLIAFAELHTKSGHNLKEVNIIVYKRDKTSPSSIPGKNIEDSLQFVSNFLR